MWYIIHGINTKTLNKKILSDKYKQILLEKIKQEQNKEICLFFVGQEQLRYPTEKLQTNNETYNNKIVKKEFPNDTYFFCISVVPGCYLVSCHTNPIDTS